MMSGSILRASVVVPTFHRHDLLIRCLKALGKQSFQAEVFEVIVADDAASAATQSLVHAFAKEAFFSVQYIAIEGEHGPAAARNAGWREAQGGIIAFTDDDCVPDCDWLASGVEHLETNQCDAAVWGRLQMPGPVIPTDYERDASGLSRAVFVTANCFVRRSVLIELGGFDERFKLAWREDSDFYFSMLKRGLQVMHVPNALVVHPIRPAPWGISLKQQGKSSFDVLLSRKHPELYREHIPPFPWSYRLIVVSPFFGLVAFAYNNLWLVGGALIAWLALTIQFAVKRLRGTSHSRSHVLEMIVTSMLIPWLASYHRMRGCWRFRGLSSARPTTNQAEY